VFDISIPADMSKLPWPRQGEVWLLLSAERGYGVDLIGVIFRGFTNCRFAWLRVGNVGVCDSCGFTIAAQGGTNSESMLCKN
jgi:hypothetical protein